METLRESEATVVRKSTPLSLLDLQDLAIIRKTPEFAGRSEAKVLQELLHIGIETLKGRQMESGYAQLAEQRRQPAAERKAVARRRRPGWADEP